MDFSRNSLFRAEIDGKKIGDWNDKPVYAMSKDNLLKKGKHGCCYILYDDCNYLVEGDYGEFWVRGEVDRDGTVRNFNKKYELPKVEEINMKNRREYKYAASDKPAELKRNAVAIDVDAYLEEVKGITVDDMLIGVRGANYKS